MQWSAYSRQCFKLPYRWHSCNMFPSKIHECIFYEYIISPHLLVIPFPSPIVTSHRPSSVSCDVFLMSCALKGCAISGRDVEHSHRASHFARLLGWSGEVMEACSFLLHIGQIRPPTPQQAKPIPLFCTMKCFITGLSGICSECITDRSVLCSQPNDDNLGFFCNAAIVFWTKSSSIWPYKHEYFCDKCVPW